MRCYLLADSYYWVVYRIVYKKSASKVLTKLPRPIAMKFLEGFELLANDPINTKTLDVKKLVRREAYRMRVGNWRALYRIEAEQLIIEVITIGARGDVYK
jgi:mRNA interferase RelE/StbE